MSYVSLQRKAPKFQEESSDLETLLLELGFLCENPDDVGSTSASFAYNAHGSMASMPHLSAMDWDFAEKLCHVTRGTTEAYYNYDGSGIRTRKVVEKNGVVETRLYLGGFEIWRKTVNGVLDTERETLHVMDDQRRIALVETLTVENGNAIANPVPVQHYQLDNHLGSASLELDDSANIISYEEYYPYGDTSYRAGRNASEVSRKRYRYTGKEKDEESSLYYCEQRYYAAHISRWVSTDPTWLEDGINLYAYVHGNPVSGVDSSGMGTEQVLGASKENIVDEKKRIENIKAKTKDVKKMIGKGDKEIKNEKKDFLMRSDDNQQEILTGAFINKDDMYYHISLFEAWKEGFNFLSNDKNKGTIEALEYIMKKSNKEKKESGFVTYKGKQFEDIKKNLGIGTKDGLTESVDINRLYGPDRQISDTLYGVHAHFNESAMSYNVASIDKKTGLPRVRGDLPHAENKNTGNGLFMINEKGDIYFVNKRLAKFIVNNINPLIKADRDKYVDQVYIGNIKQFQKK